jgi:hypothetical protein
MVRLLNLNMKVAICKRVPDTSVIHNKLLQLFFPNLTDILFPGMNQTPGNYGILQGFPRQKLWSLFQ